MDITINERRTQVSQNVKDFAEEKLEKISRFVNDAHRIEVDFIEQVSKNPERRFICEVTVHCKRTKLKAHAEGIDAATALDLAIEKTEHQAQKLKSKRVTRFHPRRRDIKTHTMVPDEDFAERIFGEGQVEEAKVVKIKELDIKPMDADEAALQMDLLGHDFFVFQNADDARFSVLYRRKDGHLGLISPSS